VACFKVHSWCSPEGTEDYHVKDIPENLSEYSLCPSQDNRRVHPVHMSLGQPSLSLYGDVNEYKKWAFIFLLRYGPLTL
jgi:hypothetical protein